MQLIQCEVPGVSCNGQQFCHIGPTSSATVCCNKPSITDPCSQPLNIGIGNANLPRFYYDPSAQQCTTYIYRGYQGNENNFLSYADCQNSCSS